MHADRLAARLLALSAAPSRRYALRLLGGLGIAGVLGQLEVDAGNKHKHKHKKKKQVTVCVNGQTFVVPKSAVPALLSQGATLGACPPVSPPPPPPLPPPPPPPFCQGKPDLISCGPGQSCSGGVCAPPPGCDVPTVGNCSVGGDCCSGICTAAMKCTPASSGQGCVLDVDCLGGNQCVGFVCQSF